MTSQVMSRRLQQFSRVCSFLVPILAVLPGHDGFAEIYSGAERPVLGRNDAIRTHQEMARLHTEMVSCLKGGQDQLKCREDLVRGCKESGIDGCPTVAQLDSMIGTRQIRDVEPKSDGSNQKQKAKGK